MIKSILPVALGLLATVTGLHLNAAEIETAAKPDGAKNIVKLELGAGWERFVFDGVNSTVSTTFVFNLDQCAYLKLTDYFCTGDRFAIYDNGVLLGDSSKAHFDNCATTTSDPTDAYYEHAWSHFTVPLSPGQHRITIVVLASPYGMGYAAIRLDPPFLKCCLSINDLTVVSPPLPFASANFACRSFGLKLADVDVFNFNDATQVVFGCAGAYSSAYIKDYWNSTYNSTCLALYIGNTAPGGAVSSPISCKSTMPVLCQGRTESCSKTFLRA